MRDADGAAGDVEDVGDGALRAEPWMARNLDTDAEAVRARWQGASGGEASTSAGPLAPDGRLVVPGTVVAIETVVTEFGLPDSVNADLVIVHRDGSKATLLSSHGASNPRWSPDGTRIAFARPLAAEPTFGQRAELWTINADGTGAQPILRADENVAIEHGGWAPMQLAWSPDGTEIAYVVRQNTPDGDQEAALYIVAADGSNNRRVQALNARADFGSVDWATIDGASTLVVHDEGELRWIRPDGTDIATYRRGDESGFAVVRVSPDGSRVLYQPKDRGGTVRENWYVTGVGGAGDSETGLNTYGLDWASANEAVTIANGALTVLTLEGQGTIFAGGVVYDPDAWVPAN